MIAEKQNATNIGVGIGIVLKIVALILEYGLHYYWAASITVLIGFGFFTWGCINYAQGKGYPGVMGLLGLCSCLGLIVMVLLPDNCPHGKPRDDDESQYRMPAPERRSRRRDKDADPPRRQRREDKAGQAPHEAPTVPIPVKPEDRFVPAEQARSAASENKPVSSSKPAPGKVDDLEEVDDLDEVAEGVDDATYAAAMRDLNRKKAVRLFRYTSLIAGLKLFDRQIYWLMLGTGAIVLVFAVNYVFTLIAPYFAYLFGIVGLMAIVLAIALPLLMIIGSVKCMQGPPKSDRNGLLKPILIAASCAYLGLVLPLLLTVVAPNWGWYSVYVFPGSIWLSHVLESIYLRELARHFKSKELARAAQSVFIQLVAVEFGGVFVVAIAAYFLAYMGTLGYILIGGVGLVYILLCVKILVEMMTILNDLSVIIARTRKVEETTEY